MDLGIEGKWALVCAASKGLGRGCAAPPVPPIDGANRARGGAVHHGPGPPRQNSCRLPLLSG